MLDSIPVTCLRPLVVRNPRFRYDYRSPEFQRNRVLFYHDYLENYYIEVPCGKCYLCRKKKANGWRVRLLEEIKSTPRILDKGLNKYRCIFVLFTFDDDHLPPDDRHSFAILLRRWRDLWRKKYRRSPRYFAVTDRGSQYGRLHLHLLIFNPYDYKRNRPLTIEDLEQHQFHWRNGMVREPSWLESERGISYVTGYITGSNLEKDATKHGKKICKESLEYIPWVFCSNGLGRSFVEKPSLSIDPSNGNFLYFYNGYYYGLPAYYRYKLIDEEFRWHNNLILKKEKETYIANNDVIYYNLRGKKLDFQALQKSYNSMFRQFDKDNNKYIKMIYGK